MKLNGAFVLLACGLAPSLGARAATATPVNSTPAATPYTTPAAVAPAHRPPEVRHSIRDREIEKQVLPTSPSPPGDRPAALDPTDTLSLPVQAKQVRVPETLPRAASAFDHRLAAISTSGDTHALPPTVAKYQDGLRAASAANLARFPAVGRATTAKINRFVFRKNVPDTPLSQPGRSALAPDSVRR